MTIMRKIAICNLDTAPSEQDRITSIKINNTEINCGLLHIDPPNFSPEKPSYANHLLIKIKAFSCNYRDKSLIFSAAIHGTPTQITAFGSEFAGEVISIGSQVTNFKIGDRVMANNAYPDSGVPNLAPGVPTNHASLEYRIIHQAKLIKIPDVMPDSVAAAFSLGAQTAYSMVRKANLSPGDSVLVTAAKSNTSLFLLQALKSRSVNVYTTSTSDKFETELYGLGIKQLVQINPDSENWIDPNITQKIKAETGGFDAVLDPFFDLHIGHILPALKQGGRYITCGLYNQYSDMIGEPFNYKGMDLSSIFVTALMNNLYLIGNCLGTTEDLEQAIADYTAQTFDIFVDSVFTGNDFCAFLDRTYSNPDRLGKVVYQYD
jgi:NADPH:quinone reductase-like Zn-dependent oxidoreductase